LKKWSNAKATICDRNHRHPSKLEARVCFEVHLEFRKALAAGTVNIYRSVSFPLLALATINGDKCFRFSPDFLVIDEAGKICRCIEAKGRESRDYQLRRAAWERQYKCKVEVVRR